MDTKNNRKHQVNYYNNSSNAYKVNPNYKSSTRTRSSARTGQIPISTVSHNNNARLRNTYHETAKMQREMHIKMLKRENQRKKEIKETKVSHRLVYLITFYGALCATLCLFTLANITNLDVTIIDYKKTIEQQNKELNNLQLTLDQSYDIKEIERIASNELNMAKPKTNQIYYIDVPNQNYIEYNKQEKNRNLLSFFKR